MSQLAHPVGRIQVRSRNNLTWLIVLLVAAAIAATTIVLVSNGSDSKSVSSPVSNTIGGPNEDLRGAAASSAVGTFHPPSLSVPTSGGPNETLRGQAIHSAMAH